MLEIKNEILEIVAFEYKKNKNLDELLEYASKIIDAINPQKTEVSKKFEALLKKYNFETIPTFCVEEEYPYITLFKGVDTWTLHPVIDYEGSVDDVDESIGIIFNDPQIQLDTSNDDLFDIAWTLNERIILTWLSLIWFSIDGPQYGIIVKTLENNSTRGFIFNDLAWDELSAYHLFTDKSKPIEKIFDFPLTVLDIYQRIKLETYPVYPYENKWRFFKKGNITHELVFYGNETGNKLSTQEIEELTIQEHPSLQHRLQYEIDKTTNLLKKGFIEFIPKNICEIPIYKGAIETKFHSGMNWYKNEIKNRIPISEIELFEKEYNIELPFYFKHYLRLFNGRKYNKIRMNFPVGEGKFLKVKEFCDIDELKSNLKDQSTRQFFKSLIGKGKITWLKIGLADSGDTLLLNLESSIIGLKKPDKEVIPFSVTFEDFIKNPKY